MNKYFREEKIVEDKILQYQIQYLKYDGPSLGLFACSSEQNQIFNQFNTLISDLNNRWELKIETNNNSKIRSFYFCLLHLLYQCESTYESKNIQMNFKELIYSKQLYLDTFNKLQIQSRYIEFYNNGLLKKIFVQFLQVLAYSRSERNIVKMLNKYPIMDFILILIIKSLLKSMIGMIKYIKNNKGQELFQLFTQILKVPIKKINDRCYLFLINNITIKQQNYYTFIIFNNQNNNYKNNIYSKSQDLQKQSAPVTQLHKLSLPIQDIINVDSFIIQQIQAPSQQYTPYFKKQNRYQSNTLKYDKNISDNSTQINLHQKKIFNIQQSKKYQQKSNNILQKFNFQQKYRKSIMLNNETKVEYKKTNIAQSSRNFKFPEKTNNYNLCDGMTSQHILKLLSPKIAQSVLEKKLAVFKQEFDINKKHKITKNYNNLFHSSQNETNNKQFFEVKNCFKHFKYTQIHKITEEIQKTVIKKPIIRFVPKKKEKQMISEVNILSPKTEKSKKLSNFSQFTNQYMNNFFSNDLGFLKKGLLRRQKKLSMQTSDMRNNLWESRPSNCF